MATAAIYRAKGNNYAASFCTFALHLNAAAAAKK